MDAVAAGDQSAFRLLYDRHVDAIYSHSFRLTGSASSAEDLTATVFLECWRHRRTYRVVQGSARPWLHGIAFNAARNSWRASRRYRNALSRLAESRVLLDPADDLLERISAEEALRILLPAIEALPPQERQALELCVAADMSHMQVAALLGIPTGTVKSRLGRALAKLRTSPLLKELREDSI